MTRLSALRARARALILACLLTTCVAAATACSGAQQRRPENDEVTTQFNASDEAELDRRIEESHENQTTSPEAKSAAVDGCIDALGQGDDARSAAAACAELFERADCRQAHRRAPDLPLDSYVATIFEECAREYCPVFDPTTRPAACNNIDDVASADQPARAWSDLRAAIWALELAPADRERLLPAM